MILRLWSISLTFMALVFSINRMVPSYGFDREKKLIDDVRAPNTGRSERSFDVRSAKVKRHTIGYLDDEYTRRLRALVKPVTGENSAVLEKARGQKYTRVPPLKTIGLPAFAAATATKARQSLLRKLPSTYTLRKGLRLNLKPEFFSILKFIIPVSAIIIGLLIALAAPSPVPINPSTHNQRSNNSATSSPQPSNSSSAGTPTTTTPASLNNTDTTTSPNGNMGSGSGYSNSGSQPATGGMGGGASQQPISNPSPSQPSGSSGGLSLPPLPVTVCVKQALNTCVN